jgi:UDP-N-acetylmuramoyl-L-alanyl-D-glutamate--2,6-diaminopimelate ligase
MIKQTLRKILPESTILMSHKLRGVAAATLYGFPGKKMLVIGVTGTKGKTTTSHLIASILEAGGHKVGLLSTVTFKIGKKEWPNETNMGTLPPFQLQQFLKQMVEAECEYAVIETTSHSLSQWRVYGIPYHVAVFTNLTHDHLDYHKTFEEYRAAKGLLFSKHPKLSVVNIDDKSGSFYWQYPADKKVSFGFDSKSQVTAKKIIYDGSASGSGFLLSTPIGEASIQTKLPGRFNIYNILAAASVGYGLGVSLDKIKTGITNVSLVPGRMEKVNAGQPFSIIVDYAHTPDSFEKIYETLRPTTSGSIIHVFGATGDRDKTKRPIMGAIAGRNADIVIVTDDEPYTESSEKIINEVAGGVPRGASKQKPMIKDKNFFTIADRREAIHKALSLAKKGDVVLLTGMGALTSRTVGTEHLPWRDQDVAIEEWKKLSR